MAVTKKDAFKAGFFGALGVWVAMLIVSIVSFLIFGALALVGIGFLAGGGDEPANESSSEVTEEPAPAATGLQDGFEFDADLECEMLTLQLEEGTGMTRKEFVQSMKLMGVSAAEARGVADCAGLR